MKKLSLIITFVAALGMSGCKNPVPTPGQEQGLPESTVHQTVDALLKQFPQADKSLVEKGVSQAAALWQPGDGTAEEFQSFVLENYAADPKEREELFEKLSRALELLYGTSNQVAVRLQAPLHLAGPEPTGIDYILGAFNPYSHLSDDLFANKTAFITILNFPFYTLEEKNTLGKEWSRLEWAYARMGDQFTTRIPAQVNAEQGEALSKAENYIASYNIMMGICSLKTAKSSSPRTWCCSPIGISGTNSNRITPMYPTPMKSRK